MVDRDLVTRKLAMIVDDLRAATPLATLHVLPPAFGAPIAACAGLRNRIVHEYDDIDPRRVHEGLQAAVRDIPEYLRRVHEHIARSA